MTPPYRVLLADPDEQLRDRMVRSLAALGFAVDAAQSGHECLAMLQEQDYQAVLTARNLGDLDAEQVLEQSRRQWPGLAVLVVSDQGGSQDAVRLAKLGLDDYLPASSPAEQVGERLREVIEEKRPPADLAADIGGADRPVLIGNSRSIQDVIQIVRLIAPRRSTVLITGPTGTGKELVARLIHGLSPRAALPMVTVNCGAIPESLLESEFFGHVKGAFTGAVGMRVGRFEQAHRSTIFLDEIGDMPMGMQAKVLRAVQEREFQRVGSSQTMRVDVRVIAATNCDLAERVRRGEFREDLYYRLNVVPMVIPALGEHLQDLPLLVDHFVEKVCRQERIPPKWLAQATLDRLMQYHWPGNVRQLENAIEKAVILSGERRNLYPSDFPLPAPEPAAQAGLEPQFRLPAGGVHLEALIGRIEGGLLEQALDRAGGNKKRAADLLGLKRTTFSAKWRSLRTGAGAGGRRLATPATF